LLYRRDVNLYSKGDSEMKTARVRVALALTAALVAAGGCGDGGYADEERPMVTPGGTTGTATATRETMTAGSDMDTCQRACATLTGCGVQFGGDCAANCLHAPVFLACARTAEPTCNVLALCALRQDSALTCGSETAGYPAGSDSCGTAATCEGMCAVANQPASCRCACTARLAPGRAINLLINNQCALAKCAAACGSTGNGAACVTCFQERCQSETLQCVAETPPAGPMGGSGQPAPAGPPGTKK
jgi:hypothetical protein